MRNFPLHSLTSAHHPITLYIFVEGRKKGTLHINTTKKCEIFRNPPHVGDEEIRTPGAEEGKVVRDEVPRMRRSFRLSRDTCGSFMSATWPRQIQEYFSYSR